MPSVNSDQIFNITQANGGKFIKLDASDLPELSSYPNGSYAILTYPANEVGISGSTVANTAYQDTPFNDQLSATGSAQQITANAKKGYITISIDADTSDVIYIGDSGVTTSNGYALKASNPTTTVSSDNLSEWYVIGASGGETVYILGAYLN